MSARRKRQSLKQEFAALIIQHFNIDREHAKVMSTEQILSLKQADHDPVPASVAIALEWTPEQYNHPTNLTIRLVPDHLQKTRKKDIPAIAKSDRVTSAQQEFQKRILAKAGAPVEPETPSKTRWPKGKIRSRGFQKRPAGTKHDWKSGRLVKS